MRRSHSASSGSENRSYVWVRTDCVDAILSNGGRLPARWSPSSRKRSRSGGPLRWGWVRAFTVGGSSEGADAPGANASSPYGNVRLRKTKSSPMSLLPQQVEEEKLPWATSNTPVTITIDDDEFAPSEMQYQTVTLLPEINGIPMLQMANSWWHTVSRDYHRRAPPQDLCSLTHLHEPAVVYCLLKRYEADAIYTYTGKILLALNPFCVLPNIYGKGVMKEYWQAVGDRPAPHIYAVAQDAYSGMMRGMQMGSDMNQSILVSGESGAGKTVTTKIIMRYLTTLSKRHLVNTTDDSGSIESQVLQSNPILESFGNARTVRNDNSSRFGKFIEIRFLETGCLVSASIETYLLEKVRLITQARGERNYHVFYELLAGLPQRERMNLCVGNTKAQDFRMTSSSGTFDRRDGVDDRSTFNELRQALDTVGLTKKEQLDLFTVACALLHCSNLSFRETNADASELDRSNTSLRSALKLLGVTIESLDSALCKSAIEARGETLYKNLSVSKATKALEALMKATYAALFSHIVLRINQSIRVPHLRPHEMDVKKQSAFIGVLDIFGFESFDVNSFEQLCINYCNEALQQQFNKYVFKLEQQEYEREGIEWSFIEFPDNQDVLDLIEKKHTGILSILDEQCVFPQSSDRSFARAVYDKCSGQPRFEVSNTQKVHSAFSVRHYAGLVAYESANFLEKNKDELPKETTDLLMSSTNSFIVHLGKLLRDPLSRPGSPEYSDSGTSGSRRDIRRSSSSLIRVSVGSQFSSQLRELRDRINHTEPHYVRCLKPNDMLVPKSFQPLVIADQLRCAGVLEAIRVSRVGFPQRYLHLAFVQRYRLLASREVHRMSRTRDGRDLCEGLVKCVAFEVALALKQRGMGEENGLASSTVGSRRNGKYETAEAVAVGIQMGRTKVFLRRLAFDTLEMLRNRKLATAAVVIQATFRRCLAENYYARAQWAILVLQNLARKLRAARLAAFAKQHQSAVLIQSQWRRYPARNKFLAALVIAEWCQAAYRGATARKLVVYLTWESRATVIQKYWRCFYARDYFQRTWILALLVQTNYRRYRARKELARLKLEAKDLEVVAAERDRFRQESLFLRRELEEARKKKGRASQPLSPMQSPEVRALKQEVGRLQSQVEELSVAAAENSVYGDSVRSPTVASRSSSRTYPSVEGSIHRTVSSEKQSRSVADDGPAYEESFETHTWMPRRVDVPGEIFPPRNSPSSGGQRDRAVPFPEQGVSTPSAAKPTRRIGILSPLEAFLERKSPLRFRKRMSSNHSASLLDDDEVVHQYETMNVSPTVRHGEDDSVEEDQRRNEDRATRNSSFSLEVHRFHLAIRQGDIAVLRGIVSESDALDELVNEMDPNTGEMPLHMAVRSTNVAITNMLLEHDAAANCQDLDGNTPLHIACNAEVVALLLEKGRANPNIPNIEGVTAVHFAVQRRDAAAVQHMLRAGADVGIADNTKWFTPLHVISHPYPQIGYIDSSSHPEEITLSSRSRITRLLCDVTEPSEADPNCEDYEGNTPLHHAVTLSEDDTCDVLRILLEKGAQPNAVNHRGQTPLHLLCHNEQLRELDVYQEMLHDMLFNGADPNKPSSTGCTALHLSLYHKDIDSAIQLIHSGAQLNLVWNKPKSWEVHWVDTGRDEILPLDMINEAHDLHRLLAAISTPQGAMSSRPDCMQCRAILGSFARGQNCHHCGRFICGFCTRKTLGSEYFPKSMGIVEDSLVCKPCEKILIARKEDETYASTQPEDEENEVGRSF